MKIRILFISVFVFAFSSLSYSQFSKQQAIDTVINHIIAADTGLVNVFISNNTYTSADTLLLEHYYSITFGFTESWVFFIDDLPLANWLHPCRYIAVNTSNGEYEIINQSIYPIDLEIDFELIHQINFKPHININPLEGVATGKSMTSAEPNPNLFAVLITGWDDTKEFWNDISNIYCTLIETYGYIKENIFVHYVFEETNTQKGKDLDGDDIYDDIDYSSYLDTLKRTFLNLGGVAGPLYDPTIPELSEEDQLFVFTNGHGGVYSSSNYGVSLLIPGTSGWDNKLYDTTLANWLQHINCSQMIFVMEPCFSGGFIDDITDYENYQVLCTNREIHTACEIEPSSPEFWVTHPEPNPTMATVRFGEFVFYWTAAVRGYYPDFDEPWNVILNFPTGTFPLESYFPASLNHPGDFDPDINEDGIVQIGESFFYADFFDTWSYNGVYAPHPANPNFEEHPDTGKTIDFQEDLLSLHGLSGEIINSQSVQGNFLIGGDLYIKPGVNLTIEEGTGMYLGNEMANITVESGASLIIEDNVDFHGFFKNQIRVDGNIQIGTDVSFTAEENTHLQLRINNTNIDLTMDNAHFNNAAVIAYNNELIISNSDFTNGGIWGFNGNFDISNTEFVSSFVNISNADGNERYVYITDNCNFSGLQLTSAIDIDNYPNFKIDNCNIGHSASAISLFNCGYGKKYHQITGNRIVDNNGTGITVYHTSAYIKHNEIENNIYGIKSYNKSKLHLEGDQLVVSQKIKDNNSYEVYASEGSFPYYFHWNLVQDDDNLPGDPLVKYSGGSGGIELLDVENNCWGYNFNANEDLEPFGGYDLQPEWECMNGSGTSTASDAENMFFSAIAKIEAEDFAGAKNDFQQIVVQYPSTKYAHASLKELYSLEAFVNNDYADLKSYYNSETNIAANPELTKLADFLINFCEIKLENWPTAIAWFENVIQNPETMEDSIFAIIDLGYTYFLMENSGHKAAYTGNLTDHIPVSNGQFEEKRDFLLSLLPSNELSEIMKENINNLKTGELLQNVPNPFSGITQIWYKLKKESSVVINVFDYTGKQIKSFNAGTKNKGSHFIEFDGCGLPNGIYFYSININGKTTDLKKMTLIK